MFTDLPLVYPILNNNTTSLTVQHLTQLGVANITVQIAKNSNQFAGKFTLFLKSQPLHAKYFTDEELF